MIILQVNHSQRLNDPQLKPWIVVRNDSVVLGAQCNCTAGFGECCSHVSATLFKVWQYSASNEEASVTSKKCKWSTTSDESVKRLPYQEGKDIVFNNSQRVKKQSSRDAMLPVIPPFTPQEIAALNKNLSECQTQDGKILKPAFLSVVRGHVSSYVPKVLTLNLPQPLTQLYTKHAREVSLAELQERAETVIAQITVTKEQVK